MACCVSETNCSDGVHPRRPHPADAPHRVGGAEPREAAYRVTLIYRAQGTGRQEEENILKVRGRRGAGGDDGERKESRHYEKCDFGVLWKVTLGIDCCVVPSLLC